MDRSGGPPMTALLLLLLAPRILLLEAAKPEDEDDDDEVARIFPCAMATADSGPEIESGAGVAAPVIAVVDNTRAAAAAAPARPGGTPLFALLMGASAHGGRAKPPAAACRTWPYTKKKKSAK